METNNKRSRGFIKDKLMAKNSSQSSSAASVGLYADAFVVQPTKQLSHKTELSKYESVGHVQSLYSYDQSIDDRAASYILSVQERFRLERVDWIVYISSFSFI